MFRSPSPKLSRRWPVAGRERGFTRSAGIHPRLHLVAAQAFHGLQERVDGGVPRHPHGVRRDALAQEIGARRGGGSEMPGGHVRDQTPVDLLRKRLVRFSGPQPSFHVTDGDAPIIRGQRGGETGRRISLHENGRRLFANQDVAEPRQEARRQVGQVLLRFHHGEIGIRPDAERFERLLEHFAMLAGDAETHRQGARGAQRGNDRRELDDFGPAFRARRGSCFAWARAPPQRASPAKS